MSSAIFDKKPDSDWTLIVWLCLGFNDTSTLVGHFVSSTREREKSGRRDSRGDERHNRDRGERGTGMKVNRKK